MSKKKKKEGSNKQDAIKASEHLKKPESFYLRHWMLKTYQNSSRWFTGLIDLIV